MTNLTDKERATIQHNIDALKKKLDAGHCDEVSLRFAISEGESLLGRFACEDCGEHGCDDNECYKRHWAPLN